MFRYSLQPLLDFREAKEKEELLIFARRSRLLREQLAIQEELCRQQENFLKELHFRTGLTVPAHELAALLGLITAASEQTARHAAKIREMQQEVEQSRLSLLERMRQRKALETMRAKKKQAWWEQRISKERKSNEELVIQRYRRDKS